MSNWNLGSVGNRIHSLVTVPTAFSGTYLLDLIDQRRIYMEDYLRVSRGTIGSTAINEKYQGSLFNLSMGKTIGTIPAVNVSSSSGGKDIALGEFKVTNSRGKDSSSAHETADFWEKNGMNDLNNLKQNGTSKYNSFKSWGV